MAQPPSMKEGSPILLKTKTSISTMCTWHAHMTHLQLLRTSEECMSKVNDNHEKYSRLTPADEAKEDKSVMSGERPIALMF